MADDSKHDSAAAKAEAPTFHVDRLTAEAHAYLGVGPEVAAGAFAAAPGSKKNFSIDEAKQLVAKWVKSPVAVDNPFPNQVEEA